MKYPVFIIIGLTSRRGRRKKGERGGGERIRVGGGVLVRCHGRVWKRNSARGTRQANKLNVVVEVEPFVFECSGRREVTRRDIDKLNVVCRTLAIVTMNHALALRENKVVYMRKRASSAERNKAPICERIDASIDQPRLH